MLNYNLDDMIDFYDSKCRYFELHNPNLVQIIDSFGSIEFADPEVQQYLIDKKQYYKFNNMRRN